MSKKYGNCHRWARQAGRHKETRYLLMLRLCDWRMNHVIHQVSRMPLKRFDIPGFPHITLYGGFRLAPGARGDHVREIVRQAASRTTHLPVTLSGWIRMQGRKGVAIGYHINPSPAFSTMYHEISQALMPVMQSRNWLDRAPEMRIFHVTIAFNMNQGDADRLFARLHETRYPPASPPGDTPDQPGHVRILFTPEQTDLDILRVSLYRNGALAGEFDLARQDWLDRACSFSTAEMRRTLRLYRHQRGYELERPHYADHPETYVISDLHLGHGNIIRYCRRPFSDAHEMDEVLIRNWNNTIRPDDRVYFLGDLRYQGSTPAPRPSTSHEEPGLTGPAGNREIDVQHNFSRDLDHRILSGSPHDFLQGQISFIAGNHDADIPETVHSMEITHGGIPFLLIHDPEQAPSGYPGWIIHGHMHNHDLDRYPFFNRETRRINTSAELTGYRPVRLESVLNLIRDPAVLVLRSFPQKKERHQESH